MNRVWWHLVLLFKLDTTDFFWHELAVGSQHTLQQPAFATGYLSKVDKA
jgi:hypothetical protein